MKSNVRLNAPGLVMTHFIFAIGSGDKWNNPPPKVENVVIYKKDPINSFVNNGDNVYYISWDTIYDSHIISTFIISYSLDKNSSYSQQIVTNCLLDGYVWITSISSGYIRVQAMDYFGLNSTISDSVQLPTNAMIRL